MAGHHTTVIVEQPTFVKNPKLIGSVYGTREWSSGICGCCTDGKSCKYFHGRQLCQTCFYLPPEKGFLLKEDNLLHLRIFV